MSAVSADRPTQNRSFSTIGSSIHSDSRHPRHILAITDGRCVLLSDQPPGSNPAHLALDLRTVQPRLLSPVPLSPGLVSVHGHDARTVRTRPYVLCSSP